MKKIIFTLLIVLTGSNFSCQKYLNVNPRSQIRQELLFESERGFTDAVTGIYTLMARRPLYGDNLSMSVLDVLAQRYRVGSASSPYWDLSQYNYDSNIGDIPVRNTLLSIFQNLYNCIANANNILEQIDAKQNLFTDNRYNLVKGEALGLRGFLHFDLLRLFGPMMDQNANDPAIPYRTILNRTSVERLTGSEVAEQIINDLLASEQLLAEDPEVTGLSSNRYEYIAQNRKYRMNLLAVQATLARVYLYIGNKEQAYIYAKKIIDLGHYPFVTNDEVSTSILLCRDRTFRNEHIFSLQITNMKGYTDTYFSVHPNTFEGTALNNDNTVINQIFENSSTDIRRQFLWDSREGKLFHSKFLQLSGSDARCTWIKNLLPVIRYSEMYYIAAESAPNVSEGLALLNIVRINRGLDPINIVSTSDELQNELTKEYQKEFFSEGQLFYYYKRKNFSAIPGSTVLANSQVYVLPIPEEEIIF